MYKVNDDGSIEMIRGDSVELDVVIYQTDSSGDVIEYIPQEGDDITFTVKRSTKDSEVLIQKHGSHISILPEDTESLEYKKYKYDVQLTLADGTVDTIIPPSMFIVRDEVTW